MIKVVREKIKFFKFENISVFTALFCIFFLGACIKAPSSKRSIKKLGLNNTPASVSQGHGRILEDNPIILSGNAGLSENIALGLYLTNTQEFITNNQQLIGDCPGSSGVGDVSDCYDVKQDKNASYLAPVSNRWAFNPDSSEFLQVQTFGHIKRMVNRFHETLLTSFTKANPLIAPSPTQYRTALPFDLYTQQGHWLGNNKLTTLSECDVSDNAFYDSALFQMCFGTLSQFPTVKITQDSTVIYHELGHALTQIMLNARNQGHSIVFSDLGLTGSDEASGLGEGIADYFSYVMTDRTHFGEWALGRFLSASRAMDESDPIHIPGISEDSGSRFSYPFYLNHDPNFPNDPIEDSHNSGQIASHYLVALTKDLQSFCGTTQKETVNNILYLMTETFAELGDLTAQASDHTAENSINLDATNSQLWISTQNPINFYSFFQVFAKYLKQIFNEQKQCSGLTYSTDRIEQLLDDYGLLNFKTYNEDSNNENNGHAGIHTAVSPTNRLRTVLIDKDLIELDPRQDATEAFIFDGRTDMLNIISSLQSSGRIGPLSALIPSNLSHNNSGGNISPGEFVGVALNLYNNSNSTMAGAQVLATDWDHTKTVSGVKLPCNTFEDNFPLLSEGAANPLGDISTNPGDCRYITRDNGTAALTPDPVTPVCFMQSLNDANSTKWVSQENFRSQMPLDTAQCLSGSSNTEDCFIRAVAGADTAFYSKIDPKKTWSETLPENGFSTGNILFFEVSPWVPPGTRFNCRFRVRFTNCSNCFTDSANADDNFLDYEYSGGDPFQILHLEFTVLN